MTDEDNTRHMESAPVESEGDPPAYGPLTIRGEIELAMAEPGPRFPGLHYVLAEDGVTLIDCPDVIVWARWWDIDDNRIVKQDIIGDYKVSTIFTGIPSAWSMVTNDLRERNGEDLLGLEMWETMIFHRIPTSLYNPETKRSEVVMATDDSEDAERDPLHQYQERYSSRGEAIAGHSRAVDTVLAHIQKQPLH